MEPKQIFRNIKGDLSSIKEELSQARSFLAEAKSFFDQKKKGSDKSKKVFTEQTFFLINKSFSEIEKIVILQESEVDSFVLYKLRKSIEDLKEKIDYIKYVEKL